MSRLMTKSVLVAVFSLATASVGFAQRQPATPGGSNSGTSTAERNRQTKDANGSANGSANGATTAADRTGKSGSAAKATFEVYKDKSGEYRWRLRATNTQILAMAAQGYSDKRSCLNAIESVKSDVANAPVEEKEAVAGKDDDSSNGAAAKTAGSRDSSRSGDRSTSGTTSGKTGSTTGSKSSQK